jgi:CHAT domain-containing protein/Tfp pilus assembly protein PilF
MLIGRQRRTSRYSRGVVSLFLLLFACVWSCGNRNPQTVFDHAYEALLHGDLKQAQYEAHRGCQLFHSSSEWAWKFRTLEAKAVLNQGLYADALSLLRSAPLPPDQPDLVIAVSTIGAEANIKIHNFSEAERSLNNATTLCATSASANCGYVLKARGLLASEQNQPSSAERLLLLSLAFARSHGDSYLESYALLSLGYRSLAGGRFDEAIDRSEAAYQAAKAVGARRIELVSQGNLGWAYYKLGDSEKALELSAESEKLASQVGDVWNQENELTNIGYIYMDARKFDMARQSFKQALGLAYGISAKEDIYNALRVLARLSFQTGDLANASNYAQQALDIAQHDGNHLDELYPMLVQGQIAARRGDGDTAEKTFQQVEHDKICPVFLKWEAEHSLARLYEDEKRPEADHEYRTALATFEAARDDVRHEDSQISFLTNAARIYDDYVHFLVARGKTDEALRWADYSRARTLSEGLGLLPKGGPVGPPPLDARQIARRAGGTLLFYWLGEKQSYLWAITPHKTALFALPPAKDIDEAVRRYNETLKLQDVLASADGDGQSLYRTLVGPAQEFLHKDTKVFIIPDGSLNNLNFETLLVAAPDAPAASGAEPKLHYWIEDATIANASSLRVLAAMRAGERKRERNLLLVGNSVAANDEYRELPLAAAQMESVASHFPEASRKVLMREQATPAAYLASAPETFSYIHFVAHGTASRLSPLDSAIVLSKDGANDESFKLYARKIVEYSKTRPLRADLVTISACYSAGERAYTGEGLVGLSWGFLRAGAHNVVAALWEVSDASTVQLMDKFYGELSKGASPDAALRDAKLSLLRGRDFHNPFYWAPFQLYARLG